MRKVLMLLSFALVGSGFVMAQAGLTVTKENVTIEYDAAKKVVRLTNANADVYSVDYMIDGKGEKVVLNKNAVLEQAMKAPPKGVELTTVAKGGTLGKIDPKWKAVKAVAPPPAAKAAAPADKAAPAADKAAAPADKAAGGKPAPAKKQ
ncbi:MAG: hypothetical protein LBD20_02815 [Spirochaetaceae bacterium]|jgi:hypothetical protein|nr:hypothetical protein [Spirochaetaceae bacterium]